MSKPITTQDLELQKAQLTQLLDANQRQCAICIGNIWKLKKGLAETQGQLAKLVEKEASE